ncbi:MAG TPA: GNAT family N-acetyltransferase [Candidatus Elarobacter sp.]
MPVNLLAPLTADRFGEDALRRAHDEAARRGFVLRRTGRGDERLAAWIDLHFGPSAWSSEAYAAEAWIGERDGRIAGFAAFDPRGLRFRWLRPWSARPAVGIFGPYGVLPQHRKRGIGWVLSTAALCALRAAGYESALIPAVDGERLIASYAERTGAAVAEEFSLDARPFRATILASGAGTNARNVLERVAARALPLDVRAVIVNRANAGALRAAEDHGVRGVTVAWDRATEQRAEYDARLIDAVARTEPELVLLLGWMHLVPPAFLRRFPETLNLHPAFLPLDPAADQVVAPDGTIIPALRGAHALRDALRDGVAWTGATVHAVTAATDRGRVLARVPVPVGDAVTEEQLRDAVRPIEFETVAAAVRRWSFEQERAL